MKRSFRNAAGALCGLAAAAWFAQPAVAGPIYITFEGGWTRGEIDSGGFNTLGPHQNFLSDHSSGGLASIAIGWGELFKLNEQVSLRAEIEGQFRDTGRLVTGSFPGPPGPPTFFYQTHAGTHALFGNLWLDWRVGGPFTLFVGGGIGAAWHDVSTNDTVVSGSGISTDFAWQAGGGIAYDLSKHFQLVFGVRYVDLGKSDTRLSTIGGGLDAGNYTLDHTAVDYRLGVRLRF